MVSIAGSEMATREVDLNELLACCRRELALRQRVYPRLVATGKLTEAKAEKETALMGEVVEFLIHCVFKAATRRAATSADASPAMPTT